MSKVTLYFIPDDSEELTDYESTYKYFTKIHPKYKIIKNKSVGVCLIELNKYNKPLDYLLTINGKNSAWYYARKAKNRGWKLIIIDKNNYIDDIYEINTSTPIRQGQKMSESYLVKPEKYENKSNYKYYGVINSNGKLGAYSDIGYYGNFAVVSKVLGHKMYLNDGIVYLMFVEIICSMIEEKRIDYLMYDTYFGASEGLKLFKRKLGFKPFYVKYEWVNKKINI